MLRRAGRAGKGLHPTSMHPSLPRGGPRVNPSFSPLTPEGLMQTSGETKGVDLALNRKTCSSGTLLGVLPPNRLLQGKTVCSHSGLQAGRGPVPAFSRVSDNASIGAGSLSSHRLVALTKRRGRYKKASSY